MRFQPKYLFPRPSSSAEFQARRYSGTGEMIVQEMGKLRKDKKLGAVRPFPIFSSPLSKKIKIMKSSGLIKLCYDKSNKSKYSVELVTN